LVVAAFIGALALTGSYYETNDDLQIELFTRGITATAEASLAIMLIGLDGIFDALYALRPLVPWYGLLMIGLLLVGNAIYYFVVYRYLRRYSWGWLAVFGLVSCFLVYFNHALIVNFTRSGILLSASASLAYLARPASARRGANVAAQALLLGVFVPWLIRPDASLMGVLLVLPTALCLRRPGSLLAQRMAVLVLLPALLQLSHGFTLTGEEQAWKVVNLTVAKTVDYEKLRLEPTTGLDSLAASTIQWYGINDQEVATPASFERFAHPDFRYWLDHVFSKQYLTISSILRAFVVELTLGLLLTVGAAYYRKSYFLVAYSALLLLMLVGMAAYLWMPSRIVSSVITVWVLVALWQALRLRLFDARPLRRQGWLGLLVVLLLLKVLLLSRTARSFRERQRAHEANVAAAEQLAGTRILVNQGLYYYYDCFSPLKVSFRPGHRQLALAGWAAINPSQAHWRDELSGQRSYADALRALAGRRDVVWVMTPEFAEYTEQYMRRFQRVKRDLHVDFRLRRVQPVGPEQRLWQYEASATPN
jgi:hypothetical protein